jgi:biopolymer transport protein TolR
MRNIAGREGVHTSMAMTTGRTAQINVTPLIDVLLVLLIIFMVIIPQKSTGLAALAPQPGSKSDSGHAAIVVSVAEDRSLTINTQPVSWNDLDGRLRQVFAMRPNGVLFVAGAPRADFEDVARVLDTARGVGIGHVALMPREP